jgi:hypothetical protein
MSKLGCFRDRQEPGTWTLDSRTNSGLTIAGAQKYSSHYSVPQAKRIATRQARPAMMHENAAEHTGNSKKATPAR